MNLEEISRRNFINYHAELILRIAENDCFYGSVGVRRRLKKYGVIKYDYHKKRVHVDPDVLQELSKMTQKNSAGVKTSEK